jgi:hypothetical protein
MKFIYYYLKVIFIIVSVLVMSSIFYEDFHSSEMSHVISKVLFAILYDGIIPK